MGDLSQAVKYTVGSFQGNAENSFERGKEALVRLALLGSFLTALGIHFGFATPVDLLTVVVFSVFTGLMDLSLLADIALLIDTFYSGAFGWIGLGTFAGVVKGIGAILSGKDYYLGIRGN